MGITCFQGFVRGLGDDPKNPTFPVEAHEPSVAPPRPMTGRCWGERVMNNFSMFTADRMTHLKVVAVALVCAPLVAGLGVAARVADRSPDGRLDAPLIKAGKPVAASP